MAERREAAGWGLDGDWRRYEVLIATKDRTLVGRKGWLIVGGKSYSVIVVDCAREEDVDYMTENGLLADVNVEELSRKDGWIVLR